MYRLFFFYSVKLSVIVMTMLFRWACMTTCAATRHEFLVIRLYIAAVTYAVNGQKMEKSHH